MEHTKTLGTKGARGGRGGARHGRGMGAGGSTRAAEAGEEEADGLIKITGLGVREAAVGAPPGDGRR